MRNMNSKPFLSVALSLLAAPLLLIGSNAQAASATMDKMKSSGAVTMGVRENPRFRCPISRATVVLMATMWRFVA